MGGSKMDTSSKALLHHWRWAAEKGLMNLNTAGGIRSACAQIVGVLDENEQADVTQIDVEAVLKRFENLKAKDFKPTVLDTYKSRFRQAIGSFKAYLNDPSTWKPGIAERSAHRGKRNGNGERTSGKHMAPPLEAIVQPQAATGLIEYPYPVREGLTAKFQLPRDIKLAEAKRIYAFISALAVDAEVPV
jgi:hypothetical protein